MDLLLAQDAGLSAALDVGKILAGIGAPGLLGFMWWVARKDLEKAEAKLAAAEAENKRLRDETDVEQRKLITMLAGGKPDESKH